jgi:hypothetical protein
MGRSNQKCEPSCCVCCVSVLVTIFAGIIKNEIENQPTLNQLLFSYWFVCRLSPVTTNYIQGLIEGQSRELGLWSATVSCSY